MSFKGYVDLEDTLYFLFTTRRFSTGATYTLAGTPAVSVYEENNATQITAGVSITADYDTVTGLNQVTIVATAANGYEAGKHYDVVITTGTVDSVSVVGEVVGHFIIGPASANTTQFAGTNVTAAAGIPEVKVASIAANAITASAVADGAIDAGAIASDAITAAKIADGAIDAATFAAGAITATVIADGAIDAATFAAGAINAAAIATGAVDADAIAADAVTEIQAGLATQASVDTIDDLLDTEIGALTTAVADLPTNAELATALGTADDAVLAAIAALNNLSAAQVNAEVVDALATDTYAEPGQGAPAATAALSTKIGYLYKAWRNRKTQTATTMSLYADDATTVDQKATTSDDGTTGTVGEIATGP